MTRSGKQMRVVLVARGPISAKGVWPGALLLAVACGRMGLVAETRGDGSDAGGHGMGGRASAGAPGAGGQGGVPPDAGVRPDEDAGVRPDGDSSVTGPSLVGAYATSDLYEIHIAVGTLEPPPFVQLFFATDPAAGAEPGGWTWVALRHEAQGFQLSVVNGGYPVLGISPCEYAAHDPETGVVRLRIPRAYVDLTAGSLAGWRLDERAPLREVLPVDVLPSFSGSPLCEAGGLTYGSGAYESLWAATGFDPDTRACAIDTDGEVRCWGLVEAEAPSLPGGPFVELGWASYQRLCGRRTDGSLDCWGLGTPAPLAPPPPDLGYANLSATGDCAVTLAGSVACGERAPLASSGPFAQVSGESAQGCAIRRSGEVLCWGFDDEQAAPAQAFASKGPYVKVVARANIACAIDASGVCYCALPARRELVRLHGGPFVRLNGAESICALTEVGVATCMGTFTPFPPLPFRDLALGEYVHPLCGILLDGRLACWRTFPDRIPLP